MTDRFGYECIDPELGGELWRLDDPSTDAALRSRLEHHVAFCAACRQQRDVEALTEEALRSGDLTLGDDVSIRRRWARGMGGIGGLAMAAGLAFVILLPPGAPSLGTTRGSETGATIERPVEGEVVVGRRPTLRWTAVPQATSYQVSVTAVQGDYAWRARSAEPSLRVPTDRPLPGHELFRVVVEPVPAHLAAPGGLRSTFRTGSVGDFLLHRARAGSLSGRIVASLGLAMVVMAGIFGRWLAGTRENDGAGS